MRMLQARTGTRIDGDAAGVAGAAARTATTAAAVMQRGCPDVPLERSLQAVGHLGLRGERHFLCKLLIYVKSQNPSSHADSLNPALAWLPF